MTDVFLSYSREDAEAAGRIARLLEEAGLEVWWDRRIPPGSTWDQVIGKALDEARCVVVLWTRTSVTSDWVKEEASRGARRGALVPVLLDRVEAPLGFGRIEAAELADWRGEADHPELQGFLAAVREQVGRPLRAEGAPTPGPGAPGRASRRRLAIAGGAALVAVVAVLAWLAGASPRHTLDLQIWQVEGDRKGAVAAASSFSGEYRGDGSSPAADRLVDDVARWVADEIGPAETPRPVEVHLVIPADLESERISLSAEPAIELATYLYIGAADGKSRVRSQLRPEDLVLGPEFEIEIAATGYDSLPVQVVRGERLEKTLVLKPLRVKVAVEELAGPENRFAVRLSERLAADPRIAVLGPQALAELRDEIERSRAAIGINRVAQVAIRDSLGVDYIVGGRYTTD